MVFAIHAKEGIKQPLAKTLTRLKSTQLIETKIYGQEEYCVATDNKTTKKKKKQQQKQNETNNFAKSKKFTRSL
jgi:hypothetical protein